MAYATLLQGYAHTTFFLEKNFIPVAAAATTTVYQCFVCIYVYAPYVCLVLVALEVRRGHWIPLNWSYGKLCATRWVRAVVLAAESSLQLK